MNLKEVSLRKVPIWVLSGSVIFPILMFLGFIFYGLSSGKVNLFFWMIMPSIFLEEVFESCCYNLSNSIFLNFIFIILFWFLIGATIGYWVKKLREKKK